MLWEIPSSEIGKLLGVSDNAVKKCALRYGLSKPPRGYWQKLKHDKMVTMEEVESPT